MGNTPSDFASTIETSDHSILDQHFDSMRRLMEHDSKLADSRVSPSQNRPASCGSSTSTAETILFPAALDIPSTVPSAAVPAFVEDRVQVASDSAREAAAAAAALSSHRSSFRAALRPTTAPATMTQPLVGGGCLGAAGSCGNAAEATPPRLTQAALRRHVECGPVRLSTSCAAGAGSGRGGGGAGKRFEPAALPFHCAGKYCR